MCTHSTSCASARRRTPAPLALLLLLAVPFPARAIENLIPTLGDWTDGMNRPVDPPVGAEAWVPEGPGAVEVLLPYLAHLVRLSGSGLLDVERAAFLVQDQGGGFGCQLWPFDNGHRRATFRGAVPSGTVAIAHTHPIGVPAPSENDRREAVRLGLRMFVASPWSVFEVTPDGRVRALVSKRQWMQEAGEPVTCGGPEV